MFSKYSSVCRNCSVNRHYSGTCNSFALVHYLSTHSSMTLVHLSQLGIKFKNSVAVEGGPLHSHLFMNDRFFFLILWNWWHLKCCWSGPNGELSQVVILQHDGVIPHKLVQLFVLGSSGSTTVLGLLKKYLRGRRLCGVEEVEMAVQEYLLLQDPWFLPWWEFYVPAEVG